MIGEIISPDLKHVLEADNIQVSLNLQFKYHRILYICPTSHDAKKCSYCNLNSLIEIELIWQLYSP